MLSRSLSPRSSLKTSRLLMVPSQVPSRLSALPLTFSKLYIQNEIVLLLEYNIWDRFHNLEDTLNSARNSKCPLRHIVHVFFFSPLPSPLYFSEVILHFSSHCTSNIGPRFQFVVWPFLRYFPWKVQIVFCYVPPDFNSEDWALRRWGKNPSNFSKVIHSYHQV